MSIKQIWTWLSNLASKLLPRRHDEKPAPRFDLDQKLGRKIQKRQTKGKGKPVGTHQGGPNMPKSQPCPKGHGWGKRVDKAVVGGVPGALYYCNHCKEEFFVRAR